MRDDDMLGAMVAITFASWVAIGLAAALGVAVMQ